MAEKRKAKPGGGAEPTPEMMVPTSEAMTQSMIGGAETMLEAQSEWLAAIEMAMSGWIERRRAALQEAAQTLAQAPRCRSVEELAGLQQHWMTSTMQRLADDVTACNEAAVMMSQLAFKQFGESGRVALATGALAQAAKKPEEATAA